MNRKGFSIIEMLAVIIILSLIASLVAILIRTMTIANQSISEEAKANVEATKLIAEVNRFYEDFKPTDYSNCVNQNCVILVKTHEYAYDPDTSDIELTVFDPALETQIEFINNNLELDGIIYNLDYFQFGNDFLITTSINANDKITIRLDFTLISEDNQFSFSTSHTCDQVLSP
jgi:prepilin-type N-terminal cleavage/methylation domain-containing protein